MDQWISELRQVVRSLFRSPGLVAMAALAIGLGVGATTTMFSITRGVLRDLPFDEADRIIAMELENPQRGLQGRGLTADEILAWRSEQHTLEGLAAYVQGNPDLSGEGLRAFRRTSAAVTLNTFSVLRVQPLLGRVWTEADLLETRPGILLSYNLWESEFGEACRDQLVAAGYKLEWSTYPMQHEVCLEELVAVGGFLRRVLSLDPSSTDE